MSLGSGKISLIYLLFGILKRIKNGYILRKKFFFF